MNRYTLPLSRRDGPLCPPASLHRMRKRPWAKIQVRQYDCDRASGDVQSLFSYVDANNEVIGFSQDICQQDH